MTYRAWLVLGAVSAFLATLGCDSKRVTHVSDAAVGGDPSLVTHVACGSKTCKITGDDAKWGGEPCCLDSIGGKCGVKSDNPTIDDGTGNPIPLTDLLQNLVSIDAGMGIVNTHPRIGCLPKGTAGKPNAACKSQSFGASSSTPDDAGSSQSVEVKGCCRSDGQCGFLDDTSGFGCVKVSESLVGQILGLPDKPCH